MIKFQLQLNNPYNNNWAGANDWFYKNVKLSKYKNFEIQIGNWSELPTFCNLELDTAWDGSDHAGPSFELTILWFYVMFKLYDCRHWDYDNNTWEVDK
jgi:hypothetical protein